MKRLIILFVAILALSANATRPFGNVLTTLSDATTSASVDYFFKADDRHIINGVSSIAGTIKTTAVGPFDVTIKVELIYALNDLNNSGSYITSETDLTKTITVTNAVGATQTFEWGLGDEVSWFPCLGYTLTITAVTPGAGETQTIDIVTVDLKNGR